MNLGLWFAVVMTRFMGLIMLAALLGDLAYHVIPVDSWRAVGYCAFMAGFWTAGDVMRKLDSESESEVTK